MRHPINYIGTYPTNWAGYYFKERLGYTSGRHTGVDYNHGTDDLGDPIYAPCNGKVVGKIPNGRVGGFGNAMIIEVNGTPPGVSGNKMYMRFLHMNTIEVAVGQTVREGQKIGSVGLTGTKAAHLHFDVWTDRNGLKAHWNYHKDTALASYEDGFRLIENNKKWNAGGELMDTDAKVKAQYYTLRGTEGTSAERKGWIGRSYEEFNSKARPEVQGRTANINNLTNAVKTLTAERNEARTQVAKLTKELLEERDKVQVLSADKTRLEAEVEGAKEAYQELEAMHQTKIAELEKTIEIKDNEIARLTKELANCGTDCDQLTGWQLIILGINKILGRK